MKTTVTAIRHQFNSAMQMEIVLTVHGKPDISEAIQTIADGKLLDAEIVRHKQKRSLDANAYCWTLCQKIAEVIRSTKEEVYKKAIREVGQFETLAVVEEAAEQFIKVWNSRGLGWYAEEMDSKLIGCKKIIAYYGSSCYDTHAMSVLIDYIVQECKELDIETMTPSELARLKQQWGK